MSEPETGRPRHDPPRGPGDWYNRRAVAWACEQEMHAGDGSQLLAVLAGEADEAGIVRRDFEWLVDEFGCGEEVMRLFLAWLEYNRLLVKLPPEVGSFWIPFESGNEVPS